MPVVGLGGGEHRAGVWQDWALWKGSAMTLEPSCSSSRGAVLVLVTLRPNSVASPRDEELGTEPTQPLTSLLSVEFLFKHSLLTFWYKPKAPELDISVPQRWGWPGAEQGCRNPCSSAAVALRSPSCFLFHNSLTRCLAQWGKHPGWLCC